MSLNDTRDGFNEIISHHLPYEVRSLRSTYYALSLPVFANMIANALIESFCIHSRNLIDFFKEKSKPVDKNAAARHFTETDYVPFQNANLDKVLYGKLSEQIAHISYGRTKDDHKKIGAKERKKLFNLIEAELVVFSSKLKQSYKSEWPDDMSPVPRLKTAESAYGACTDISFSMSDHRTNLSGLDPTKTGPTAPLGPIFKW